MKIIDYHAHLGWDQKRDVYLGNELLEDMDQNGIEKRLVSALYGYGINEQNDAVAELVKAHPDRIIGSAVINPKERNCVDEVKRIIDEAYSQAKELIGSHIDVLHKCVELLLEKEKIGREEFEALFSENEEQKSLENDLGGTLYDLTKR